MIEVRCEFCRNIIRGTVYAPPEHEKPLYEASKSVYQNAKLWKDNGAEIVLPLEFPGGPWPAVQLKQIHICMMCGRSLAILAELHKTGVENGEWGSLLDGIRQATKEGRFDLDRDLLSPLLHPPMQL